MKGALPETGRAKSKGADAKPEAGRDAHFTGTKIIYLFTKSIIATDNEIHLYVMSTMNLLILFCV